MHTWKLSDSLDIPKDNEWDLLLKLALGDDVHVDRKRGFILSRMALLHALSDIGLSATPQDLILQDYSKLKAFPHLTVSLSHTKDRGAALIADQLTYRSIGIDIEQEARLVKDAVAQRIAHPEDLKLRNIEIWCLKEAVFKTLMNSGEFERPVEFSSIRIEEKKWSHSPSGLEGEWELDLINSIVMARAYLKN